MTGIRIGFNDKKNIDRWSKEFNINIDCVVHAMTKLCFNNESLLREYLSQEPKKIPNSKRKYLYD